MPPPPVDNTVPPPLLRHPGVSAVTPASLLAGAGSGGFAVALKRRGDNRRIVSSVQLAVHTLGVTAYRRIPANRTPG